ncbi:MAG TPA: methyltransferase [Burkholderiales bacterium]|nr:methyltransferase [Burkholderiales bacterium]
MSKDSSGPEFWDERYRGGTTPWDAGAVPPALFAWLQKSDAKMRILVPGCGSGYEVRAFAERGHDVLGIDFSDAALENARRELGELADRVRKADFFQLAEEPFDLVYERTFLCALPRRLWPDWARGVARLVRPGGRVAGFFFLDDNERGPPFGIDAARLNEMLGKSFEKAEDAPIPAEQSVPVLAGKEVWQVWKRRL